MKLANNPGAQEWGVFLFCFIATGIGVLFSFLIFGGVLGRTKFWVVALAITAVMIGLSYSAKASTESGKRSVKPIDVLFFFSQGLLWPSAWPAMAAVVGIVTIAGPKS